MSQQSVNSVVKSIYDVMRRSNCAGALQYVPELTWILFLRILDEREAREFLAQAYEHMAGVRNENITSPEQLEILEHRTFYGREKDNTIYPIALANLILHDVHEPHIWHGNTLTGRESYGRPRRGFHTRRAPRRCCFSSTSSTA